MFKVGDPVEFIDQKKRSIHQGLVTVVTSRGARVRDPRMQSRETEDQAEWFPFRAPNGSHLRAYSGKLDGPSSIEDIVRAG